VTLVWTPGYDDGSTYTPGKLVLKKESVPFDNDAWEYIARVETADGQILEQAVRNAITNFVIGCKADGIWTAVKASCILAGARTLAGALVPLVGAAPTNGGGLFVSGDYNRKTGLVGNGTTKYLDSNLSGADTPSTNSHIFVNGSSFETTGSITVAGVYNGGAFNLLDLMFYNNTGRQFRAAQNFASYASFNTGLITSGSLCGSRTSSTSAIIYQNGVQAVLNAVAATQSLLGTRTHYIYAINGEGVPGSLTSARLNFYSIGSGLTAPAALAFHDRITSLVNAFAAAIP